MTEPRREPRSHRPARPYLVVAVALALAVIAVAWVKSYRDLETARAHESRLEADIADAERRVELLQRRVRRVENEPATLERLAREELGMVRPGDVVIVLPDDEPPPPRPAPPGGGGE